MTREAPFPAQLAQRRRFWREYFERWMDRKLAEWEGDLDILMAQLAISREDWQVAIDYLQDEAAEHRKEAESA